eukprot:m.125259 g.125259  ORF g.125259 m.125259 type:complete len:274 (-) comp29122_c0_seq2:164-985(-)
MATLSQLFKLNGWNGKEIQPRNATLLLTLPFLPLSPQGVLPFSVLGIATCLLLHHVWPNRAVITLTAGNWLVIFSNFTLGYISIILCTLPGYRHIYPVTSLWEIPWYEWAFLLLWGLSDEIIFFHGHRFLHRPGLYERCHKWHHHFKITNVWTSWYSHPLDHQFLVFCAMSLPSAMLYNGIACSAPVFATWCHVGSCIFLASHHAVAIELPPKKTDDKGSLKPDDVEGSQKFMYIGSKHLLHHTGFNVNYGNFEFLDSRDGTYKDVPTEWRNA